MHYEQYFNEIAFDVLECPTKISLLEYSTNKDIFVGHSKASNAILVYTYIFSIDLQVHLNTVTLNILCPQDHVTVDFCMS